MFLQLRRSKFGKLVGLLLLFMTIEAVLALAYPYGHTLESPVNMNLEKRVGQCAPHEVTIISTQDRILCIGVYVLGAATSLFIVSSAAIAYVSSAWADTVNYKKGFQDGRTSVSSKRDGSTFFPDWDQLGIEPVQDEDGNLIYTYDANVLQTDQLLKRKDTLPYRSLSMSLIKMDSLKILMLLWICLKNKIISQKTLNHKLTLLI